MGKNPSKNKHYSKGDIFSCPACEEDLLKFKQDVYEGQSLEWVQVERINHIMPEGESWETVCPYCLKDYFIELIAKG